MTTAGPDSPGTDVTANGFFAEPLRDYTVRCLGAPVTLLQAGCLAPLRELGIGELAEGGFDISVTTVDGDLRTVPIAQRAYDIVYCAGLLERVRHVELVLDRLVSALKPGGLLLIRIRDRYSAGALLDRLLPGAAGKALWSRLHPGTPGPFPAVYEKTVSDAGIASYTLMRGLVIAARGTELTLPSQPVRLSSSVRITYAAISRLTRGRFGDNHDELLYVIRRPQDQFARVV